MCDKLSEVKYGTTKVPTSIQHFVAHEKTVKRSAAIQVSEVCGQMGKQPDRN